MRFRAADLHGGVEVGRARASANLMVYGKRHQLSRAPSRCCTSCCWAATTRTSRPCLHLAPGRLLHRECTYTTSCKASTAQPPGLAGLLGQSYCSRRRAPSSAARFTSRRTGWRAAAQALEAPRAAWSEARSIPDGRRRTQLGGWRNPAPLGRATVGLQNRSS